MDRKKWIITISLLLLFSSIFLSGCIEEGEKEQNNKNKKKDFNQNQLPIFENNYDIHGLVGDEVIFNISVYDPDGYVTKYEWDFDDDGIFDWSSLQSGYTTYIYNSYGEYFANFSVTDNNGSYNYTKIKVLISLKMLLPDPELYITFPFNNQTVNGTINITGTARIEHYTDEIVDAELTINIVNSLFNEEYYPTLYTENTYDYQWFCIIDISYYPEGLYKLIVQLMDDVIVKEEIQIIIKN
ncbi:MAG: PKD domain-containing protein [Candidatus Thorarchaeota archaeon]